MKPLILKLCLAVGIIRLFTFLNRRSIGILALHQVADPREDQAWQPLRDVLSTETFERFMSDLALYYNFVSMDDAVAMIRGEIPPVDRALAITFDDGYRNNLTCALPVLKQRRAPFAVFLTAGLMEQREPMWVDRLDFAIEKYNGAPVQATLANTSLELRGSTRLEKAKSFSRFRHIAKSTNCDDRDFLEVMASTAASIEQQCNQRLADVFESDQWTALLTWEDITRESSDLVSYGSHTMGHVRLARVPPETASAELGESKSLIEERTGRVCDHFAYPDGSFDTSTALLVAQAGYRSGLTSDVGMNQVGDDPFRLKRINVPNQGSSAELLARLSGLNDALSAAKRLVRR